MTQLVLSDVPDAGRLDAVSVPLLLAQAWRDERSARLELEREQTGLVIEFVGGSPVSLQVARGEERFAHFLEDAGELSTSQRVEVERIAVERACPEASAVLALGRLDAKALYRAIRTHQRTRLAGTFEWNTGTYRWDTNRAEGQDARSPRPFDVLRLLQQELPRRWGPDRLFRELMSLQEACGDVSPRNRRVAEKLAGAGEVAARAIGQLDGSTTIGTALGQCAGEPLAAATLWVAVHGGVLRLGGGVAQPASPEVGLEIEVEVRDAARTGGASAASAGADPLAKKKIGKALALREEITQLLGRLSTIDHYGALGLDESASATEVKKAYFKAAKKYHPDALARLGLDELKQDAASVFARIAEAFETLSDPDKRRVYDAGGTSEPDIDTARLAQAETSYRKGEILAKMGNFEGALEYLEPAAELWPEEPAYQALLGWALYRQPKCDAERAAQHLELALADSPRDAVVHLRLGRVLRALGKTERSNALVARARELDPDVQE